jgi:Calcineurin-like phosphoesterase
MTFGVVADVHGNFEAMQAAMTRHPEVAWWLCVGDLASRAGAYPEPAAPLHWIKGNNENYDAIEQFASGAVTIPNLHYIPNGHAVRIGDLTVAGLGGTYAPRFYETAAAALPRVGPSRRHRSSAGDSRSRDDRRRHFVREEVEACTRLTGVDILLTHEAPRRFWVQDERRPGRGHDAGQTPINQVLAAVKPRLHLFGHHHLFAHDVRQGVASICVDRVSRSYLLVDPATWEWQKIDQPDAA